MVTKLPESRIDSVRCVCWEGGGGRCQGRYDRNGKELQEKGFSSAWLWSVDGAPGGAGGKEVVDIRLKVRHRYEGRIKKEDENLRP